MQYLKYYIYLFFNFICDTIVPVAVNEKKTLKRFSRYRLAKLNCSVFIMKGMYNNYEDCRNL